MILAGPADRSQEMAHEAGYPPSCPWEANPGGSELENDVQEKEQLEEPPLPFCLSHSSLCHPPTPTPCPAAQPTSPDFLREGLYFGPGSPSE